jgi:hypothetical protein
MHIGNRYTGGQISVSPLSDVLLQLDLDRLTFA